MCVCIYIYTGLLGILIGYTMLYFTTSTIH